MFQGQMPPPPGGATYPYPSYGAPPPQPGFGQYQQPGYPPQGSGYPPQGPGYPSQGPGYPPQGPPHGYGYGQPGPSDGVPPAGFMYGQPPKNSGNDSHVINDMPEQNNWSGFEDKSIRQAFVRKVYSILSVQLLFTAGLIALFILNESVKTWVKQHRGLYFLSYALFLGFYIALVCCQSLARKHPINLIMLFVLTGSLAFMAATISTFYDTRSVLFAALITASCCLAITLFATCTKYDITSCAGVLFVISWVFFLGGMIFFMFVRGDNRQTFHLIYACIGALLFMMYLAYETQLIFGGKKYQYSPEDYVVATIQLYVDIVNIFILILSIFGGSNRS